MMLLHDLLKDTARRRPDHAALTFNDAKLSYGELDEASDRLAVGLQKLGVGRGDRVAVFLENSPEFIISLWGALKAGGVFVPVNHAAKSATLAHIVSDAEAKCLIAQPSFRARVEQAAVLHPAFPGVIWSGEAQQGEASLDLMIRREAGRPADPGLIDQDLCLLIYTSGSTGDPKGVMLTHHAASNSARAICAYLQATPQDIVLGALPMSFSYGLFQVITAARAGFAIALARSFAFPVQILKQIAEQKITGLPSVPGLLARLLDLAPYDDYDLSHLRYVTNAAAPLPPAHIRRLRELLPQVKIYSMYGQTECTRISFMDPERLDEKVASVGRAMPNCEAFVIDETGRRCKPGEAGELVVRGSNLMRGYWRRPQETARILRPDPATGELLLHTGDLFRADADGDLFFVGRSDDVFKCRGEKVSPRVVENVLHECEDVAEAAIIGVPDPIDGMAVKAFVALRPGREITGKALRLYCMGRLESWLVPKHIEFCDALPKTQSGKITRKVLRERAGAAIDGGGSCAA